MTSAVYKPTTYTRNLSKDRPEMHTRMKFVFSSVYILILMSLWTAVLADSEFKITPEGDIFLQSGTDLEINCTINNSSFNASLIDIGLNCNNLDNGDSVNCREVQGQSKFAHEDQDKRTMTLRKSNVTIEDAGMYVCKYGDPPKFRTIKAVNIADLPAKPENVSCISYNNRKLECSASLQLREKDIPMQWQMDYKIEEESGSVNCTVNDSMIDCPEFSHFYPFAYCTITLRGSNENYHASINRTFNDIFTDYSIVKPGPVKYIDVNFTRESTDVTLTWEKNEKLIASSMVLVYRIELVSLQNWTRPKLMMKNITLTYRAPPVSYSLTGLIPNANYQVTITCKPSNAQGDQYWSEPVTKEFQTNIAIPERSVQFKPGSFTYLPANDSEVYITLYWKNPSPKESHGDIKQYRVEIHELQTLQYEVSTESGPYVTVNRRTMERWNSGRTESLVYDKHMFGSQEYFILDSPLNVSSDYSVKVWVGNDAGFAVIPGEIHVPSEKDVRRIQPSLVIVEKDFEKGRSKVSWEVGHSVTVAMATVYYCVGMQHGDFTECQNFNWQEVNGADNHVWVDKADNVDFAVSLEDGLSGGMVWQDFQFVFGKDPETPVYSVNAGGDNHTVLYVSVNQGQESSRGKPTFYDLVWREQEKEECPKNTDPESYPADFKQNNFAILGLKPGSQYVVCMRSRNSNGSSHYGKPVLMRTSKDPKEKRAETNIDVIIWLSVGGTLFGIAIAAIIVVRCRRKIKSLKLNTQICDIEILSDNVETFGTVKPIEMKPRDQDSGTQTGTPASSDGRKQGDTGFTNDRCSFGSNMSFEDFKAKKRNSSSGISGYLRVDGDISGLTMGEEHDSLMGSNGVDDEDELGEENEYFDGNETAGNGRKHNLDNVGGSGDKLNASKYLDGKDKSENLYHEIVDMPEVSNSLPQVKVDNAESNGYAENTEAKTNRFNSNAYIGEDPKMKVDDYKDELLYTLDTPPPVHTNMFADKNQYLPNMQDDNQNRPSENRQKSKTTEIGGEDKPECNNPSILHTDSKPTVSGLDIPADNAGGNQVETAVNVHGAPDESELPDIVTSSMAEHGPADIQNGHANKIHNKAYMVHETNGENSPDNIPNIWNEVNDSAKCKKSMNDDDISIGATIPEGTNIPMLNSSVDSGRFVVELDESNNEFDDQPNTYCKPDCISLGEVSVSSDHSSTQQNDTQKSVIELTQDKVDKTHLKDEIQKDKSDVNNAHESKAVIDNLSVLAKSLQTLEKQNGRKGFKDSNMIILSDMPDANMFREEPPSFSEMTDKPLAIDSCESYDSYVHADVSQSV